MAAAFIEADAAAAPPAEAGGGAAESAIPDQPEADLGAVAALPGPAGGDPGAEGDPAAGAAALAGEIEAVRVATLRGVRLGGGATLLLEPGRAVGEADLRAILAAARPLLQVLRDRGLSSTREGKGRNVGVEPGRERT
jgi:hypothetical protein